MTGWYYRIIKIGDQYNWYVYKNGVPKATSMVPFESDKKAKQDLFDMLKRKNVKEIRESSHRGKAYM